MRIRSLWCGSLKSRRGRQTRPDKVIISSAGKEEKTNLRSCELQTKIQILCVLYFILWMKKLDFSILIPKLHWKLHSCNIASFNSGISGNTFLIWCSPCLGFCSLLQMHTSHCYDRSLQPPAKAKKHTAFMFDFLASLCCFDLLASSHHQQSCCLRMTKSSFHKNRPTPGRWQTRRRWRLHTGVLYGSHMCLFSLSLETQTLDPKPVFSFPEYFWKTTWIISGQVYFFHIFVLFLN